LGWNGSASWRLHAAAGGPAGGVVQRLARCDSRPSRGGNSVRLGSCAASVWMRAARARVCEPRRHTRSRRTRLSVATSLRELPDLHHATRSRTATDVALAAAVSSSKLEWQERAGGFSRRRRETARRTAGRGRSGGLAAAGSRREPDRGAVRPGPAQSRTSMPRSGWAGARRHRKRGTHERCLPVSHGQAPHRRVPVSVAITVAGVGGRSRLARRSTA